MCTLSFHGTSIMVSILYPPPKKVVNNKWYVWTASYELEC
jgi:hypothetical protein